MLTFCWNGWLHSSFMELTWNLNVYLMSTSFLALYLVEISLLQVANKKDTFLFISYMGARVFLAVLEFHYLTVRVH